MKTELKAKFLQHILNKKKDESGFTLIELLVVIIIIGILSAIALPSFLNQANKARASEAKTYAGSVNRAQQAYYLEAGDFVTDNDNFGQLQLGINTQTANYVYTVDNAGGIGAAIKAIPAVPGAGAPTLKGYGGFVAVGITTGAGDGEATTLAVLTETLVPLAPGAATTLENATLNADRSAFVINAQQKLVK
ncbi:type IV pilin-like G/H family protein [Nodularia sphaerocarpa]|uniref:type IV pilin-like G/H family protein n=1 Tax=Nodularia sphaerocarpa TaxID=137816 RepID=UPI001EFB2F3A|nr:type IV pilin-like G/H family protein [Nodularia sphaerocarpa]MDB9375252.1 type IV pilin-like G/H family protein [Nodularia sphaerocarpa CS-585]MDB9377380.1 type IV pilin-like G/H family protein [Nodularia sphaerocarpa CS-585A2]ULP72603.1 Fimbrial protein [Nodularia sphaerocarpa UHCC 0038]